MITTIRQPTLGAVAALLVLAVSTEARAQGATGGEARVVVDGDEIRVEATDGAEAIQGDWRVSGSAGVDTEALLFELGAVHADDHIRLSLAGDVLFELGSAVVTEAAEAVLHKVAQVIRARALAEVMVVGHTDSTGDAAFNQRLSEARALAVIRWLQAHERIPAALLVGRGVGESRPTAHERTPDGRDDPAGRARNRRVEMFLGTTADADVRAAAGLVTVSSPLGTVRVTDAGAGGVRIDAAGVEIGGLGAGVVVGAAVRGAAGAVSDRTTACPAGRHCTADCPEGGCRMLCSAGAVCDYGCRGGGCEMSCASGATCDFGCAGGSCLFTCAIGSRCERGCAGGDCRER